jgi:DNA-binding transcriptional regulator YhcF (GntR family)
MSWRIDPTAAVPVSEQIAELLRFAVASGRLRPGERVESVRGFARQLVVNPNTVAKVYRDLEREKVLASRPGSGVFVAPGATARCRRSGAKAVREAMDAAIAKALATGMTPEAIEDLWSECLFGAGEEIHVQ